MKVIETHENNFQNYAQFFLTLSIKQASTNEASSYPGGEIPLLVRMLTSLRSACDRRACSERGGAAAGDAGADDGAAGAATFLLASLNIAWKSMRSKEKRKLKTGRLSELSRFPSCNSVVFLHLESLSIFKQ